MANPTSPDEMPFSLEWLAGAAARPQALAACTAGHLKVNGNSCWRPVHFTADLRALVCELVDRHN